MATKSRSSLRAQRLWARLTDWYGTRLTEQYGKEPPGDWCEVVDKADNDTVTRVLIEMRNRHVTHPPTFPEFEALFAAAKKPKVSGPSAMEILDTYVKKNYPDVARVTWLGNSGAVTGVLVDGVGKVMLVDVLAGAA